MTLSIPCRTFVRLVGASLQTDEQEAKNRVFLRSLRLERRDNNLYAVASNSWIMAIELLGPNAGEDAAFVIQLTDALLAQCELEQTLDGILFVNPDNSVHTTFGFSLAGAVIPDEWPDWKQIVNRGAATKRKGSVVFNNNTSRLLKTAPSGHMVFPPVMNSDLPIICRDPYDENWIGVFMSIDVLTGSERPIPPATKPEWLK